MGEGGGGGGGGTNSNVVVGEINLACISTKAARW